MFHFVLLQQNALESVVLRLEITALQGAQAIKTNQTIELIKGDHLIAETSSGPSGGDFSHQVSHNLCHCICGGHWKDYHAVTDLLQLCGRE